MGRILKLVFVYLVLQFVCQFGAFMVSLYPQVSELMKNESASSSYKMQMLMENSMDALAGPLGIGMLLSGILMAAYLIGCKYVDFSMRSVKEVSVRVLVMSLPLVFGALTFCNLITEALDLPDLNGELFLNLSQTVGGFLAIAVMAPIVEELLFRGAIEGHLLRLGKSPRTAILVSALIFGILHFNPAQSFFAFMLGLVFGWLYYRTGSVIPGMVAHAINNTICATSMVLDPEHAQMSVTEQYGTTAYTISLALSFIFFVGGYLCLRRELAEPPFTFVGTQDLASGPIQEIHPQEKPCGTQPDARSCVPTNESEGVLDEDK